MKIKNFFILFLFVSAFCFESFGQPGTIDPTFNSQDIGFGHGDGANGSVYTTSIQSDGKIIIGGGFSSYNGVSRGGIARLNTDGTIDLSFNPDLSTSGIVVANRIQATCIQNDGKIIIGGEFTNYNGAYINRIVRLNPDGTIDPTFNISGSDANGGITTIAIQSDGKIILGGFFTYYGGGNKNYITRLNTDGTIDPTFTTRLNGEVLCSKIQNDGKIIVGGQFTMYDGKLTGSSVRLNEDGTLDLSFRPEATVCLIRSISLQNDGKILLGGEFSISSGKKGITRLNSDGTTDISFNTEIEANSSVYTSSIQSDGKIIIGGNFLIYGGSVNRCIARLNSDGSYDFSFNIGTGASGNVLTTSIQNDGKIIIGGNFSSYNEMSCNKITRLNTNGTFDFQFNFGSGVNTNSIRVINIQSDGKIIIGGDFTTYNGKILNRIGRLNIDGSLDQSFNVGLGANNSVFSSKIQNDGKIIIGGDFTSFNGNLVNKIARLNIDGTLDSTFNIGLGGNGTIYSISIQNDGKIIIGGDFTSFNGNLVNRITRLNIDGTNDSTFNVGLGGNNTIYSISIQNESKIIIGGKFTVFNRYTLNRIARLNIDGSIDQTFNSGTGPNGDVFAISIQNDGKIIIGGRFSNFNGANRSCITRLRKDGALDIFGGYSSSLIGKTVNTISIQNDGKIIIGGSESYNNGFLWRLDSLGYIDNSFCKTSKYGQYFYASSIQNDGKIIVGGNFTSCFGTGRNRIARIYGGQILVISTENINPLNYCAGTNISIPYSFTGSCYLGNIFTAQISDSTGSFITPTNIGSLTSNGNGTILATIPSGQISGTGYRIRVISSIPQTIGSDNGQNLTVYGTSSSQSTTACDSIEWNGTIYSTSGVFTYTTNNMGGCDSTAILNLTINHSTSSIQSIIACDNYIWFGTTYTTSGTYTHILPNKAGCDSTITLNLTIKNSSASSQNISSCDTYTWYGNTYSSSGIYTHILTNEAGCDSTITLNLTIKNSTTATQNITACNTYTWFGNTYTTSGTHTHVLPNIAGCDSTITLNLTIKNSTNATQTISACDTYTWFGNIYTISGIYTHILPNVAGCDSTITLNLTIKQSSASSQNATACDTYTWFGNTYTTSGIYTHILPNAAGCDSTITLNLTLKNSSTSTQNVIACNNYSWFGNTYITSGTHTRTLPNKAGCDSTITLNLTINPLDTTVAIDHSVFTTNVSGSTYQWLDCSNGNQLINGATTQSFTAADKTHEYAVIISKNGCSDTSSCLKVSTLGLNSLDQFTGISIYPNPTSNELFIVNQENTKTHFEFLNAVGQVIFQGELTDKTKVETSHFAPGVYVVKLENEKGIGYQKVVKE